MALTLAFDTSAAHCAAALLSDDGCLLRIEAMGTGQAERLMPLLEEVLVAGGAGWRDLTALGVGIGPGNFTGVRIGVAAARGLALALKIPAIGVSVFEALALGQDALVAQDARRGMVYLQGFAGGAPLAPPVLVDADAALPEAGLVIGDAAAPVAARLGARTGAPLHPLPEAIARIAAARADRPQPRPAPLYLRSADAAPPRDPPPVILP